MFQLFQTEWCECGKMKQVGKACKTCGLTIHTQPTEEAEGAYELPKAVSVAMPVGEDDMERARR